MTSTKIIFILLMILSVYGNKKTDEEDIIQYLDSFFESSQPGGLVLVSRGDTIVVNHACGMANTEKNIPVDEQTIFAIGPITKQFTSVAILKLIEDGKLNLNDKLSLYLPEAHPSASAITIEHLLTHTSGLKDVFDLPNFFNLINENLSINDIITIVSETELLFDPGSNYNYSGMGYILLGFIIEKVSGVSYIEYLRREIFIPLKMHNAGYGYNTQTDKILVATGYFHTGSEFKPSGQISMSLLYSAGGLFMSTKDLFKWMRGINSSKIVSKELIQQAWTPFVLQDGRKLECGYGWDISKSVGRKTIMHGGSMWGYDAFDLYFLENDTYIIALTNSTGEQETGTGKYASKALVYKIAEMLNL